MLTVEPPFDVRRNDFAHLHRRSLHILWSKSSLACITPKRSQSPRLGRWEGLEADAARHTSPIEDEQDVSHPVVEIIARCITPGNEANRRASIDGKDLKPTQLVTLLQLKTSKTFAALETLVDLPGRAIMVESEIHPTMDADDTDTLTARGILRQPLASATSTFSRSSMTMKPTLLAKHEGQQLLVERMVRRTSQPGVPGCGCGKVEERARPSLWRRKLIGEPMAITNLPV
uniref:Uncharacterized protein n=1 Tax=Steinernema glaseri TaxID=37863 RepID=A0A1I7Y4K2_9BILA